jgi:hypothetical protein
MPSPELIQLPWISSSLAVVTEQTDNSITTGTTPPIGLNKLIAAEVCPRLEFDNLVLVWNIRNSELKFPAPKLYPHHSTSIKLMQPTIRLLYSRKGTLQNDIWILTSYRSYWLHDLSDLNISNPMILFHNHISFHRFHTIITTSHSARILKEEFEKREKNINHNSQIF